MNFQEADRLYDDLKQRFDAGEIPAEEFDAERKRLMLKDDEGRWWTKSRKTGGWHYRAESGWVPGTPPNYEPPDPGPSKASPEPRTNGSEEGEQAGAETTEKEPERVRVPDLSGKPPWQATDALKNAGLRYYAKGRVRSQSPKGTVVGQWPAAGDEVAPESTVEVAISAGLIPGWVIALCGVGVVVVGLIIWGAAQSADDTSTLGDSDGSYATITDDSGALSMEAPDDWYNSSSSVTSGEEEVGPALMTYGSQEWESVDDPWVFIGASKAYAQDYDTDEAMLDAWTFEGSDSCQFDGREDYFDGAYYGVTDSYSGCGSTNSEVTVTAASPTDRGFVMVIETGAADPEDEQAVSQALDTFEVDESALP